MLRFDAPQDAGYVDSVWRRCRLAGAHGGRGSAHRFTPRIRSPCAAVHCHAHARRASGLPPLIGPATVWVREAVVLYVFVCKEKNKLPNVTICSRSSRTSIRYTRSRLACCTVCAACARQGNSSKRSFTSPKERHALTHQRFCCSLCQCCRFLKEHPTKVAFRSIARKRLHAQAKRHVESSAERILLILRLEACTEVMHTFR